MVLSGTVLDLSLMGRWFEFESHWLYCIVSLSKTLYPLCCTGSTNMTEKLLTEMYLKLKMQCTSYQREITSVLT